MGRSLHLNMSRFEVGHDRAEADPRVSVLSGGAEDRMQESGADLQVCQSCFVFSVFDSFGVPANMLGDTSIASTQKSQGVVSVGGPTAMGMDAHRLTLFDYSPFFLFFIIQNITHGLAFH
jgi:hypothetical protein